jgi:endonuclease/exonuclease/phosphatase family metal-dependent hydrolase
MPFYKNLRKKESKHFANRTIEHMLTLRTQLRKDVPARTLQDTLLLATWNIRDFDSNKFHQGPRLDESFYYIAEIIASFDLVAVQEVTTDLGPLKRVMSILGPNWDYIVTDVTEGLGGNKERLAFVFDKRKIMFRNIAGEIVLPLSQTIGGEATKIELPALHSIEFTKDTALKLPDGSKVTVKKKQKLEMPVGKHVIHLPEGQMVAQYRQFARTPFMVAFQAGWFKFNLCTVHLYYGDDTGAKYKRRVNEISAISKFLADRAKKIRKEEKTGENFILLGDLNIVNPEDPTMKALTKNGFTLPEKLYKSNVSQSMYYDQIAFMVKKGELEMGPSKDNSGVFRFFHSVFRDGELSTYHDLMKNTKLRDFHEKGTKKAGQPRTEAEKKTYYCDKWRTWQMSDHYPLWVELKIDFSDRYLKHIKSELNGT